MELEEEVISKDSDLIKCNNLLTNELAVVNNCTSPKCTTYNTDVSQKSPLTQDVMIEKGLNNIKSIYDFFHIKNLIFVKN